MPVAAADDVAESVEAFAVGRHNHRRAGQAGLCTAPAGRERPCTGCLGTVLGRCKLKQEQQPASAETAWAVVAARSSQPSQHRKTCSSGSADEFDEQGKPGLQ